MEAELDALQTKGPAEAASHPSPSTGIFGRALSSTAAAYKFFWLLALLRLAPHGKRFLVRDVVAEMIIAAWPSAALYRLSFGIHDRLQDVVRDLQLEGKLAATATETRVRRALADWPTGPQRLDALARYVPSRFLAPWFGAHVPRSVGDDARTRALLELALRARGTPQAGPYTLQPLERHLNLEFDPAWHDWMLENLTVLRGFAELELARFLQSRNPHVPGITDKIGPPPQRDLAAARRWFVCHAGPVLYDLYTGEPLIDSFAVDHFLPRAFVAHDLLWNLAPTATATNRMKADALPDPAYLGALSVLHHTLIGRAAPQAHDLEDYAMAFGTDVEALRAMSAEAFAERHAALLRPLLQIAANQGFRAGWRAMTSPASLQPEA